VVREHLKAFLEHLGLNENASAHTVRAYDSDLVAVLVFLAAHLGSASRSWAPTDLDHLGARAFIADQNKRGNSKSSAARKLSAIRALGRYLRREGAIDGDPAALVGTPKREQRHPESPCNSGNVRAPGRARHVWSARTPRQGDPRAVLRVRAAPE
jgi:integrase/recombinase XerC